jgi:hypothetical protein
VKLRYDAQVRGCTHVGPGDYVKIGEAWKRIAFNTATGEPTTPRSWIVETEDGNTYDMFEINLYAKAGDFDHAE